MMMTTMMIALTMMAIMMMVMTTMMIMTNMMITLTMMAIMMMIITTMMIALTMMAIMMMSTTTMMMVVVVRFLEMHMYITSALQKTDMKAVGLQLALELLHEKVKRQSHKQKSVHIRHIQNVAERNVKIT
jgi:hypothetical protein